ncbi:MAG: tetratricopeptide repeat protein, partial [Bacteroidia bacterium]|nr:tetratricopeptide repeat protein [Bacteroidia bacterium]
MMRFSLITFFIWIIGLSFTLAQENDSLLRKINNYPYQDSLKVNLLNTYGWSVINNSPDSSLAVFNKARDLSEKLNWTIGRAKSLGNIGVAYYYLGNYPMALKNYLAALTIWEENKSLKNMATLYGNIGIINGLQKEYTDAEKYYLKAIAIAEKLNDKAACAQHYGNLGMILSYQGKSKEALIYHNKALKKDEELADSVG